MNLTGYFLMAREITPRMLEAGPGGSSTSRSNHTTMNRRGRAVRAVAGGGGRALSRIMAADLADTPVRVNLLLPGGATETGMLPPGERPSGLTLIDPARDGPPIVWLASPHARDVHDERDRGDRFRGAGWPRD